MAAERPSSRGPEADAPAERQQAESLAPYLPVLSPSSREAFARANGFRRERRADRIHMEHLLAGLLMKRDGPAQAVFSECGLTSRDVSVRLRGAGKQAPEPAGGDGFAFRVAPAPIDESTPLSRHVREAVEAALERARAFGDPLEIKSRDLLLGMGAVQRCSVVRAFGDVFTRAPAIVA
ncbi:MAG TPA: Clp protease N-terminal domain-containing protein, partial [Gemmatimonadaceae bacterium]|nr:Clp protease N-terminal domain-containing protein [Gemmatimonadaceae bacterium]